MYSNKGVVISDTMCKKMELERDVVEWMLWEELTVSTVAEEDTFGVVPASVEPEAANEVDGKLVEYDV